MTLKRYGPNMHVLDDGRIQALFSYQTLVAVRTPETTYISKHAWGVITSKHINSWMRTFCPEGGVVEYEPKPQGFFDNFSIFFEE